MKPLFFPLKSEYYEAFLEGSKTEELRLYGGRWNEKTCKKGRKVILSKGYGKHDRMRGKISGFRRQHGSSLEYVHREAIKNVYGSLDIEVARIGITDIRQI